MICCFQYYVENTRSAHGSLFCVVCVQMYVQFDETVMREVMPLNHFAHSARFAISITFNPPVVKIASSLRKRSYEWDRDDRKAQ